MNSKNSLTTISEILISESKQNITERKALDDIREVLRNWGDNEKSSGDISDKIELAGEKAREDNPYKDEEGYMFNGVLVTKHK